MTKEIRALINRANAQKLTGPRTPAGRQRSAMNAVKHNLTGSRLILQPDEMEAYNLLSRELVSQLKPMTELERQTVAKIIDTHFRLNRLACVENNIFNFGLIDNTTDTPHDDRIEIMIAQTRSWIERSSTFDALERSSAKDAGSVLRASVKEARLTRQVLQFTRELEHLQKCRKHQELADSYSNPDEIKPDTFDLASFGRTAPALVMTADSFKVLSSLPPHKPRAVPHVVPQEMQA